MFQVTLDRNYRFLREGLYDNDEKANDPRWTVVVNIQTEIHYNF